MMSVVLYVGSIILVNWGFSVVPVVVLPWGQVFTPLTFIVGFVFVIRDYAQRRVGKVWILPAMGVGIALSYVMADPFVATASAVAFALSEFVDWLVYSFTARPFAGRILVSSAMSTPVDSVVFLAMISQFSIISVVVMVLSKMVGAVLVWRVVK